MKNRYVFLVNDNFFRSHGTYYLYDHRSKTMRWWDGEKYMISYYSYEQFTYWGDYHKFTEEEFALYK